MVVELDGTSETLSLVVVDRTEVADGVVALALESADLGPLPSWTPGSHIEVEIPDVGPRHYSLCGRLSDPGRWQIAVLSEPNGRGGSAFIHQQLEVGSQITASGPWNHFKLRPADSYIFIAGGIGITPILSMVHAAAASGRTWKLLYGGRQLSAMAFVDEVAQIGDVTIWPQDTHGFLPLQTTATRDLDPGTAVYACGPPGMLNATRATFSERSDIGYFEEAFVPADTSAMINASITVNLVESDVSLLVPPDRSILDVVEEAGIDVIASCREGTCGTCEVRVVSGDIDHRDVVLTDTERAGGDCMMICVSRCHSPILELEL